MEPNVFYLPHSISMCETVGKMAIWLDRRKPGSSHWDLLLLNNVYAGGIALECANFLYNGKEVAFVTSTYVIWSWTVPPSLPIFNIFFLRPWWNPRFYWQEVSGCLTPKISSLNVSIETSRLHFPRAQAIFVWLRKKTEGCLKMKTHVWCSSSSLH